MHPKISRTLFVIVLAFSYLARVATQGWHDCRKPLGMASGDIQDNQIRAASVYNKETTYGPSFARLGFPGGGYRADPKANQAYIMVSFNKPTIITGIATQGFGNVSIQEWVKKFYLGYTNGGGNSFFKDVKGGKQAKQFDANIDSNSIVRNNMPVPESVSTINIMPIAWNQNFAIRFELYGCLADGYECLSTPCQNNGTCVDMVASYHCNCTTGFNGTNCQYNIDDCANSPCNGGNCTDLVNNFSCDCPPGYTGKTCNIDIDECVSSPCQHGGSCKDVVNGYECTCIRGYGGKKCEEETGFFLIVWLQVKAKQFTMDFMNRNSAAFKTNAFEVNQEIASMLTQDQGFLSSDVKRFSPDSFLVAEVLIECLKNSTGSIMDTMERKIVNGARIFKNDYIKFGDTVNSYCKPPNVTLPFLKTLPQATHISRHMTFTVSMPTELACQAANYIASYNSAIYSINNITGSLQNVYRTFGNLAQDETIWKIPAKTLGYRKYYVKVTSVIENKRGTWSCDFGFIVGGETLLESRITGSSLVYQGIKEIVYLNGSGSYDPDVGPGNYDGMEFTWFCRRDNESFLGDPTSLPVVTPSSNQSADLGGCYGTGVGRLESSPMEKYSLGLDIDRMEGNAKYVIALLVKKGERSKWSEHSIFVKEEIDISLKCIQNCRQSVIPSGRLIIERTCEGLLCNKINSYAWYLQYLDSNTQTWLLVPNFADYILTYMNSPNLVTKENLLKGNTTYLLRLTAEAPGGIVDTTSYRFVTNRPPTGGTCDVDLQEGKAWLTFFSFACSGWQDVDLPLTYKFQYNTSDGIEMVFFSGKSSSARARLPVGDKMNDMMLHIQILVLDYLGSAASFWLHVKVTDPAMSSASIEEAVGKQGEMNQYLQENNIELAAQHATSVLSVVNNASPQEISLLKKIEIKDSIVKAWSNVTVTNLEEIGQVSAVVTGVSDKNDEVSFESQKTILTLLGNMTTILESEVSNKSKNDVNEQSIQGVGSSLLHGVGNFIEIAAINASLTEKETGKTRQLRNTESEYGNKESISMVQKAAELIDQVGSSLAQTKELYEKPSVFTTKSISMVIDRQKPDLIGGKTLEENGMMISLPGAEELLKGEDAGKEDHLSTQMVSLASNPFTWDTSAQHVRSSFLDFKLKNTNGTHMEVKNLKKDFELFIPVKHSGEDPPGNQESYFVKPSLNGSMQYHIINIPGHEYAVSIKITPLSAVNLTLYMRYGSRPTFYEYNYTAVIPNFESCNSTKLGGFRNCTSDPYTVTISSALTGHVGLHYIGIFYKRPLVTSENRTEVRMRMRRDCFSSGGRQKRSLCVGVKDPPPTESTIDDLVPKYNPKTDVNYTMSVTIATCLFWNTTQQKWTSYGCRVGPRSRVGLLHCRCNHLSSFGGNFFVAPNPIDFNKVLQRFTDFDPENFVVFFVVFGIFGLYLVALVIARRADRKDKAKATETLRLLTSNEHLFEISVYTGMWRNNGTTANVAALVYGQNGQSEVLPLNDRYSKRKLFARASVNVFIVSLPDSLGPMVAIKLWHDNEGTSPSWYINQIVIRDLDNDEKTYFVCNRWLAVDKEDGEVHATFGVSSKEELSSFKYQFYSRISKNLGDGHLWLSVVTRPPHSPFTRAQRVSCCLSVLYCAMVASAMFYQFGEKNKDSIKFGPLRLSVKQLMIGIQSALIVVPINLILVTIFRNVKFSNNTNKPRRNSYLPEKHEKDGKTKQKTPGCFPHFFVYIGWFLCMATVIAAGTFTILYSLSWGGETSNQWLTSILIAYVQDIGVIQPIKVVSFAVILALIIKKPVEEKTSHSIKKADLEVNTKVTIVPPEGEKLEEARKYRKNIVESFRAVGEIVFYLMFVVCLMVFVYGNRGYDRYRLTKSIDDIFTSSFKEISTTQTFWNWARTDLVPGLYDTKWYRPGGPRLPEGYISSKEAFLVGMPRFRQLRVKTESPCEVENYFPWSGLHFNRCILPYEPQNEYRTPYNFPRWIPVKNISTYGSLFDLKRLCPKPWRYMSSKELNTFSIQGVNGDYDGGGYVADLGYNSETALGVINDLQSDNWIDRLTSLVILEFTVFEPTSSLFSHAKFIYEVVPSTGKPLLSVKIETLSLYESPNSSLTSVKSVIQVLLLVFIFIYLISEIGKIMQSRCKYFASFWNWLNIVQLLSASTAVILFFFKSNYVSRFIKQIQANPYQTTSMDYVLLWCNLEIYIISVVIFVVTIKFLRLLRFNRHICQMTASISNSSGHITTYSFIFLIDMIAFGILGVLVFGHTIKEYSSLVGSLRSLFQKFLGGKMVFYELLNTNRIIAPLFVFLYMASMTFILVNMFVAILNDSYESVRHISGGKFPDSDLGTFMREYYRKRFQGTHDILKRKLGRFGYRAKKYDPRKEEERASNEEDNCLGYTSLSTQEFPSHVNLGFSSESLASPIRQREGLVPEEDLQHKPTETPELSFPATEAESLDSNDVAMETATTVSVATTSTTPELFDLISDLPESLVDDEDTVDIVRDKLSNVGAILRLSKRTYRRFSISGDKFVVQRDFRIKPAVQINFTPETNRKQNVTLF